MPDVTWVALCKSDIFHDGSLLNKGSVNKWQWRVHCFKHQHVISKHRQVNNVIVRKKSFILKGAHLLTPDQVFGSMATVPISWCSNILNSSISLLILLSLEKSIVSQQYWLMEGHQGCDYEIPSDGRAPKSSDIILLFTPDAWGELFFSMFFFCFYVFWHSNAPALNLIILGKILENGLRFHTA